MNAPVLYASDTIDKLLDDISDKKQEITNHRMELAAKIADGLKAKGWNKSQLAEAVGKQPSVITKWLSGTHNFTSDTLPFHRSAFTLSSRSRWASSTSFL